MNSTNWHAPNVWVFIAKLVEHCSANAEAMGSNNIEVPNIFPGKFAIAKIAITTGTIKSSFNIVNIV